MLDAHAHVGAPHVVCLLPIHTYTQILDIEAANAARDATAPSLRTAGANVGAVLMPPPAVPPPLTQAQVCGALP